MEKIRIYKDAKELPFLIYKRIKQTGDFLYMIKGYDEGDDIESDLNDLEERFNSILSNLSLSNDLTEEMHEYINYVVATSELNKFNLILDILDIIIQSSYDLDQNNINTVEENQKLISDLLKNVIIARNSDINILRQNICDKISVHQSNVLKYKEKAEKESDKKNDEEYDIDDQLINIFLILEIPIPDENKMTLHQYFLYNKKAFEKAKQLEKINSK